MSPDENDAVRRLLDPHADSMQRAATLKWISEYLEEGYILNLPASPQLIEALTKFSKTTCSDRRSIGKAKSLLKEYGR